MMMMQADYKTALLLIRSLLRDNVITIRITALAAVSMWEDKVSAEDVRKMAHNDPNPFVRPQAILTQTRLVGQDALPDLVALSRDVNLHVRRAVAQGFVDMEHLPLEARKALIRLGSEEATAEFTTAAILGEKHFR